MSKDPVIFSQDNSDTIISIHEHQYGQTLPDLTFLVIDGGTIEFSTLVKDGVTDALGISGSETGIVADIYII